MTLSKAKQLRHLITSDSLEFLMEAHSGLSAKIVEESGFKGIWASGLSISASLGVRDNNEASWTQVLDVVEFMCDATSIPILLDGDTGYGNFNNVRRLIHKLEQRGVAGVCLEDKLFPKTNSFILGESQPLADMNEFCGKIKAAKDHQKEADFCVVARLEAFIAGWGVDEALRRAYAYAEAGADALLVHSKKSDPSDIDLFMSQWDKRIPIIIVPTKYYSTPTDYFRQQGISVAIWANHNIRASIKAIQETSRTIFQDESLINVEGTIVSVAEVFRLQSADELKDAEKRYLPTSGKQIQALILAASQGKELGTLTTDIPKTLLQIHGKSILETQIQEMNQAGIKMITVVRGFAKDKIRLPNISTLDNDDFSTTQEVASLFLAKKRITSDTLISYGDIVFKPYILHELLIDQNDITIVVDSDSGQKSGYADYVVASRENSKNFFLGSAELIQVTHQFPAMGYCGEFIGLWKLSPKGAEIVSMVLEELSRRPDFSRLRMQDLLMEIIPHSPVAVRYVKGGWMDIDTIMDLQLAGNLA